MAKAADSTPKRGKSTSKTATTASSAKTAAAVKPRSRTTKRSAATKPSPAAALALEQPLAQLMTRVDVLEENIATSVSTLHTQLQAMQAEWQSMKDLLQAMQHAQHETQERQANQAAHNGGSPEEPSETFLPVVADLIRRNLTEHLSPMTTTLRRLEERIGFVSNRLKPAPGGQDRQKPWRRDQRGDQRGDQRDQAHHFRSRGQGAARQGQGDQAWTPPSAESVQGHFAPRRYPSSPQIGDEEE
jgi:hypothetical protein